MESNDRRNMAGEAGGKGEGWREADEQEDEEEEEEEEEGQQEEEVCSCVRVH